MSDNKWGRKLVANEIRPLLYTMTESFRKYESVNNLDSIIKQINALNLILDNNSVLELLNQLSVDKYEVQSSIREMDKINDKIQNAKSFKDKMKNFDEEKEIQKLEDAYKTYFSLDNIGGSVEKEFSLLVQYRDMQADFCAYYIIKKLEPLGEEERMAFFQEMREKRYVDSTTLLPEIAKEHDFIYSYIRVDQIHIDSTYLYFYFEMPDDDFEEKRSNLNEKLKKISQDVQDVINKEKHTNEVQF